MDATITPVIITITTIIIIIIITTIIITTIIIIALTTLTNFALAIMFIGMIPAELSRIYIPAVMAGKLASMDNAQIMFSQFNLFKITQIM